MYELNIYRVVMCHDNENDAKFEEELTCRFKTDMRNLANFHRLKNSDFILESKMAVLN